MSLFNKSGNPAMRVFEQPQRWDDAMPAAAKPTTMTIGGVAQTTGLLLGIVFIAALAGWTVLDRGLVPMGAAYGGVLAMLAGGFIIALILARKPHLAPVLAPIYSVVEGLFCGVASFAIATAMGAVLAKNPGLVGGTADMSRQTLTQQGSFIILQAVLLTIGVAASMMIAFRLGFRIKGIFARVVLFATGGIMLLYLASWILGMFHIQIPGIFSVGPVGLIFSLFVVGLASLNLVLDFQMIERGVAQGMPKKMEWFAGFALISTLVWLYIEILRLLFIIYSMANRD